MAEAADDAPLLTDAQREAIRLLGHAEVPELVAALARPLERGHHLALLAGEGSGKDLLYGLAASLRCDPASPELQALVLSPTRETALRSAAAAHALGASRGLSCLAWPPGWGSGPEEAEAPLAHLLAGRPEAILADVRAGRLGLGHLRLVVIDGVGALETTGAWSSVEAIVDTLEEGTQRIASADGPHPLLDDLLDRRLPRARRWPPELFPEPGAEPEVAAREAEGPPLLYATAEGEEGRLAALAEGLRLLVERHGGERALVHCPEETAAHRAAAFLAAAGFRLAPEADDPGVAVVWGADEAPTSGIGVRLGLPSGLEELRRVLGDASHRLIVVEPAHLAQLRLLAKRAGWRFRAAPSHVPGHVRDEVASFRERVRSGAERADPGVELLLLEPLLRELGSARVAAGLAALVREAERARPAAREARPAERADEVVDVVRPAPRAPRRKALAERGVRPSWTRIWLSVGQRDGAGPGDLVGAITGETGVVGGQIGKIEIRTSYSLVDLDSQIVDEVIAGLQGKQIKGRDVHVRVARES